MGLLHVSSLVVQSWRREVANELWYFSATRGMYNNAVDDGTAAHWQATHQGNGSAYRQWRAPTTQSRKAGSHSSSATDLPLHQYLDRTTPLRYATRCAHVDARTPRRNPGPLARRRRRAGRYMSAENFLGDVYSHWGTMPSTAMSRDHRKVPGLDRAAPVAVPVGRTFAHRSMLGGPSEQDAHKNMYSGTRACTPGAGAYCPEESQRKLGIGFGAAPPARQLRRPTHPVEAGAKPRGTATMGTEVRRNNAHLAAHRYAISPRPGPGDHNPNHNSKSTIAAGQFVPRDAPREDALKIKLSSVNWRLRSLRSGLKDLDRLPADKRRVVLLETKPGGEYVKSGEGVAVAAAAAAAAAAWQHVGACG